MAQNIKARGRRRPGSLKKNVLVTSANVGDEDLGRLSKVARVYASWKMSEEEIDTLLPDVDVLIVHLWPEILTADRLAIMQRLRFVQSMQVGVNHIPFANLRRETLVASNAGAYSVEVGEHAWALLLTAAKNIVEHHQRIRKGAEELKDFWGEAAAIVVLEGKTLGIIGYGGVGRMVARYAKAFGMNVLAFSRKKD